MEKASETTIFTRRQPKTTTSLELSKDDERPLSLYLHCPGRSLWLPLPSPPPLAASGQQERERMQCGGCMRTPPPLPPPNLSASRDVTRGRPEDRGSLSLSSSSCVSAYLADSGERNNTWWWWWWWCWWGYGGGPATVHPSVQEVRIWVNSLPRDAPPHPLSPPQGGGGGGGGGGGCGVLDDGTAIYSVGLARESITV